MRRWLIELGFKYKERKKSYFSDKHEFEEIIEEKNKRISYG